MKFKKNTNKNINRIHEHEVLYYRRRDVL